MNSLYPFARPLYIMAKPVGSLCNLACNYCYYLEKESIYREQEEKSRFVMSDRTLEEYICQYIAAQTQPYVLFVWHGGEPLMRPISFYQKVLRLQQKYARGRYQIENCIQTNGTLLNEEWCAFFANHHWLVGVSIDGPQEFHDAYRKNRGGQPSFAKVMKGIELLNRYGVEWNAMGVVNNLNADYPLEVYNFYKSIGCRYIQFAPIIERLCPHSDGRHLATVNDTNAPLAEFSVTPEQYGNFVCTIFDEWVRKDVGRIFVQLFDAILARWVGEQPGVCTMAENCGHAGVIEHNGDLYTCDHFVVPEYLLGNIHQTPISELMNSDKQYYFGRDKMDALPQQCRSCKWLFACNGGCPKDRFLKTETGEGGLNYMCKGFKQIFERVSPYMDFMKNELQHQRPPANVMEWAREIKP